MDLETFGTLATLGSARVAYTRKQAHHVAAEGRPVFDADGKPYIEVTTRVPVDHMPGVEIVRMFDIGATLPDVVRTFVHYRPPHERWYPDYCDFWHEVPHGTQKETYDEGKVTCPWCLRQMGAALLRRRPNQSRRERGRRHLDLSRRGEGAAEGTGGRWYLCRQRRLGGVPLVLARLVEGLSTHQCAGGPWRLENRRNCSQVSPCAGRLPSGRGPNADRPFDEPTTSTARRVAAATWMMSSTTVASRAYAVVPARRSRWSRGGASRPSSAPAAGSARHRADASRRDRAARSPDPQPASCRRSFRRGFRARAAPSTRHRWCPRPDQQPLSGCVGRDVLAGACVPNPGAAGAVPVRVRSRSSAGLRWTRGRLWHPRRQHRPLRTGLGSGDRCKGRRFAARRIAI